MTYPGGPQRRSCAARTRNEVAEMRAPRPLPFREELRIAGMLARCELCRACPSVMTALSIMAPPRPELATAEIIRLAG